jgi:hypothetical protein
MQKTLVGLSLAPAFLAGALLFAQEPIAVHVTAMTDVPKIEPGDRKAVRKELEAKWRAAHDTRKAAEKELKAQHGKKKDAWPPETQAVYLELEDDEAEAEAALAYLDVNPKGLSDSAQDIRESLAGKGMAGAKEYAKYVNDAELADIIVEVVGRRSTKSDPTLLRDNQYYVAFKIKGGPNFDASRLGKVPPKYTGGGFGRRSVKIHTWSAEEPYITLEAFEMMRWASVGNTASAIINTFLKDNYAALTGK